MKQLGEQNRRLQTPGKNIRAVGRILRDLVILIALCSQRVGTGEPVPRQRNYDHRAPCYESRSGSKVK